ncbi:MAG TPA: ATP-binding protein [Gemmatimonadota bacterium]|jgi:PAS domain S-box-containing protein
MRPSHERRVLLVALLGGLPAVLVAMAFLWTDDHDAKLRWTLTLLIVGVWWFSALALRTRVAFPLQTVSNLLAALREGDFSIRARGARHGDALGEVLAEVNTLGQTLREQRLGALEATALLWRVMAEIDVAVFAFDENARLRLVNRGGERLLGQSAERLLGRDAAALELEECLRGEAPRMLERTFPGGRGRWEIRRTGFRQGGRPHHLLVLSDLSRVLREEERQTWQRLVRVLSHEINNSLAPIQSLAGSLAGLLDDPARPTDRDADLRQGLSVIADRSQALSRFMASYARLARLPPPTLQPVDVGAWIHRVARLEGRLEVKVEAGPETIVQADGDQLDQLLINLISNAVDAALQTGGGVSVGWRKRAGHLEVWVRDDGHGVSDLENLFVPFFTTKPSGSGIGLVLSRQIAEGHGGTLALRNRRDRPGCEALLRLPIQQAARTSTS